MDKTLCALLILLASGAATADPAPFGLELGIITQGQAGIRYPLRPVGINALTLGEQFDLDGRLLPVAGLKQVRLIFGQDRLLLAVVAHGVRERYDALYRSLTCKYRAAEPSGSVGGERHARFIDGNCEITLVVPPGGDDLELSYIHRRLWEEIAARQERAVVEWRSREAPQL